MVNMDRAFVWAWDARPYPYFPNNLPLWSDAENYARGHWLNGRTSSRSLASVVREICTAAGLTEIDTSELYGQVRGYVVSDVADARRSLQPLMLRYSFDAIERGGKLVFKMRNGRGAVDLDPERLALSSELDGTFEQTREPEASVAGRVRLRFMQADARFDVLSEEEVLADEQTHAVSTTEIPIALTRVEGRQVAERWLTEARVARDTIRFALPPSRLDLGAGDVVTLARDQSEGSSLYRIDRVEQGIMQIAEAVRIDREVCADADMSDEVASPPLFVPPVPVFPLFLDLPLMTGNEVAHAPFMAASAQPWPGAVAVYQSATDSDFKLLDTISARATIGTTQTTLGKMPGGRYDYGAPVRVKLMSGTLSSVDEQALLSGENLAAIGDGSAGNWELFQFQKAELVDKDTYDLSVRLRGQLGTDGIMPDEWPEGSYFVLFDGIPEQIGLLRNYLRVVQTYRIGPAKRPVSDPSYIERVETFEGNGLRPYMPVHLTAKATQDGGLHVSWIRRTRIDGDLWEGLEVPLGEEAENYLIKVVKNGIVLREEIISQPVWIYPLSAQASDGLTGDFEIGVAQVSATYGPGPAAQLFSTV